MAHLIRSRQRRKPTRVVAHLTRAAPSPPRKTSGVVGSDVIRVLRPSAVRFYHDGMTVMEFLSAVGDSRAGLEQILRSHRAGLIAIEAGDFGAIQTVIDFSL